MTIPSWQKFANIQQERKEKATQSGKAVTESKSELYSELELLKSVWGLGTKAE
jgi:hypothetical protein